ncbi:uncharacterized protein LOC109790439 [Cajanus cajan]|uniref:uncharacterized protein LOC109790439 n=1 Tax=Cajanus cajan TaxID=3821 RepID=UPI00098D8561|nr:uncharacterized protein LOC109790439 [Cajanus cajan]
MTYTKLLPHLTRNGLIVPFPLKPIQPPYPKGYDPNAKCDYHAGGVGHSTERCWGLKHKVQDLIDMGLLSFKEDSPNVGTNPLLGHGSSSVNIIEEVCDQQVKNIGEIKTSMRFIFSKLFRFGMIEGNLLEAEMCGLHPTAMHSIEKCDEFKQILQDLIDSNLVQVSQFPIGEDVLMAQSEERPNVVIPRPLVIHFTRNVPLPKSNIHKPLIVQVPTPFPYKDTKAIPWKYNVEVKINGNMNEQQKKEVSDGETDVTNIAGVGGMTRSGRIYTLEELREGDITKNLREKEKATVSGGIDHVTKNNGKNAIVQNEEEKKEVLDEEALEFLKFIRQSEYKLIDQLDRTPTRVSLLSLLMNSESHRKLLMKILNEAHVANDITLDKFGGIIGNIIANNRLTFTDEEIPVEGRGHNKALHISVSWDIIAKPI